jgi:HK97 family phage major capsid protein
LLLNIIQEYSMSRRDHSTHSSNTTPHSAPSHESESLAFGPLETKAFGIEADGVSALALNQRLDDLQQIFEAFKATNDEQLGQFEQRGAVDPVTTEKLTRIEQALDNQQRQFDSLILRGNRLSLGVTKSDTELDHKAAFNSYIRKGDLTRLTTLERKALSVGSEADGGYLAPPQLESTIGTALRTASPMRSISGVLQISAGTYKKPFSLGGTDAGWVGETADRPQTASPRLAELSFPAMELYAMPAATLPLLDDSLVNIDDWLANEVQFAFAKQESQAFVAGDGVTRPKGFLSYPKTANTAWTWGSIGYVPSGAAAGFAASDPAAAIIDLVYALKSAYRVNARFVLNRLTQAAIRKMKDAGGHYLWQPSLASGEPATLMGFPVSECEEMPDIAAGSFSLAFGDFGRGYLIVDRAGTRILRDPFVAKPYVLFYTTKRVGGGVQDFDAIKLMKFAVS